MEEVKALLELGWPAVVLLWNFILWRELQTERQAHMADLREVADLRPALNGSKKVSATDKSS